MFQLTTSKYSPLIRCLTYLAVPIVLSFSGCLEKSPDNSTDPGSNSDIELLEGQRLIDGNLTWSYLDTFLEPNPTKDLTGTWVGLNTQQNAFFALHLTSTYDDVNRYYYYEGIRAGSSRGTIKTDDGFNILDITSSSSSSITTLSWGHIEFTSISSTSSPYVLKKISNDIIDIGQLDYTTYLYSTDQSLSATDQITYYEERWNKYNYNDFASISWVNLQTVNQREMYFSQSGTRRFCEINTEVISISVHDDCFITTIYDRGTEMTFNFIDTDGNSSYGSYNLNYEQ